MDNKIRVFAHLLGARVPRPKRCCPSRRIQPTKPLANIFIQRHQHLISLSERYFSPLPPLRPLQPPRLSILSHHHHINQASIYPTFFVKYVPLRVAYIHCDSFRKTQRKNKACFIPTGCNDAMQKCFNHDLSGTGNFLKVVF